MAKGKPATSVQNRPMYSRISFLQQAATYLALPPQQPVQPSEPDEDDASNKQQSAISTATARRLASDLRSISLKTRIRLSPALKQTICKHCDALLIEGQSCTTIVENKSKGGRKPWADVLVRKCHACGNVKRHPLNSSRQKRKTVRDTDMVGQGQEAG